MFIEGQVNPPLSGVEIVISSAGDRAMPNIKVQTDNKGKYRLVFHFISVQ